MKKWGVLLLFVIAALWCIKIPLRTETGGQIRDFYTHINQLSRGLMFYADKHGGSFPDGETSTEIFQKLIDDNQIQSGWVYFDIPGKKPPTGDRIVSENVCFDFTRGANANSPNWVPLIFPTGYSINYKTGEATKLPSFAIQEDPIKVAYTHNMLVYPNAPYKFYFFKQDHLNIMRGKPADADVSQYQQLSP